MSAETLASHRDARGGPPFHESGALLYRWGTPWHGPNGLSAAPAHNILELPNAGRVDAMNPAETVPQGAREADGDGQKWLLPDPSLRAERPRGESPVERPSARGGSRATQGSRRNSRSHRRQRHDHDGLRCIDIDIDDRAKTKAILEALRRVVRIPRPRRGAGPGRPDSSPSSRWMFRPRRARRGSVRPLSPAPP